MSAELSNFDGFLTYALVKGPFLIQPPIFVETYSTAERIARPTGTNCGPRNHLSFGIMYIQYEIDSNILVFFRIVFTL